MRQDLRFALRALRKSPGFTAAAVTMLALGIGVNTAVFTVTDVVLSRGFRSVVRSDRILYIGCCDSYPDFLDWRSQAKSFSAMGAVADSKIALNDPAGYAETLIATRITANTFRVLGQQPMLGRDFTSADEAPGATPVAILSHSFWATHFAKDPRIVGRTLRVQGSPPITVIGVMPAGFSFPQNQELWVPLTPTPGLLKRDARDLWFVFGRLAPGVTPETAKAEMKTIANRLANTYPHTNRGVDPSVQSFAEFFVGKNAAWMYTAMWAAVGFVLLIACANLANLTLARGVGRSHEFSLQIALGSGQCRLVRQLLIESLALSAAGGVLGWGIAQWGVHVYGLATSSSAGWNRDLEGFVSGFRTLAYLLAISLGTGFLFGLMPALRYSRLDVSSALKDGSRGSTAGGRGTRLSRTLIAGETALAVVLLAGAGVMIRSFLKIYTADPGADIANTRTMLLHLPEATYRDREAQLSFFDRLNGGLETIPGVESTSIGLPPASGIPARSRYELASENVFAGQRRPAVPVVASGPGYFRTLRAQVISGRDFNRFDNAEKLPIAIVNQRFATQHWPKQNPLGQRMRLLEGEKPGPWLTVVGVASNIVYDPSRQETLPVVYVPYAQQPSAAEAWILLRTRIPAAKLTTALRRQVSALDSNVPIWLGPYDLTDRLAAGRVYRDTRNYTLLLLAFAAIALLLASLGLHAVVAHTVGRRTQEIGVRVAVGARPFDIAKLVLRLGMLPSGLGLMIGLGAAFALNRVLSAELVGVTPADPMTLVMACAVLLAFAALGCWMPARRAMRVDPVVALRQDNARDIAV